MEIVANDGGKYSIVDNNKLWRAFSLDSYRNIAFLELLSAAAAAAPSHHKPISESGLLHAIRSFHSMALQWLVVHSWHVLPWQFPIQFRIACSYCGVVTVGSEQSLFNSPPAPPPPPVCSSIPILLSSCIVDWSG